MDFQRARDIMQVQGTDALVITSPFNFAYASGVHDPTVRMLMQSGLTENAVVVPKSGQPVAVINSALLENVERAAKIADVRLAPTGAWVVRKSQPRIFAPSVTEGIAAILRESGVDAGNIGVELRYLSVNRYNTLQALLPRASFCDCTEMLWRLRSVKTQDEIQKMRKAIGITERAMQVAFSELREGMQDFELIQVLKKVVIESGADMSHANWGVGPGSGEMFSNGHGRRAARGDIIRFDIGVECSGYRSDLARIAVVGEPSSQVRRLYDALLEAERRAVQMIRPGLRLSEVHRAAVETVRKHGYTGYARWMVGHSVGLECEEEPFITATSEAVFEPGMVFCVEVPWYEPQLGGLTVEDTVVVTESGHEELSSMARSLAVV